MSILLEESSVTPLSSKRRAHSLFDSDEECSILPTSLRPALDKDTDLRTRLFDDEESRDSGVGMGNDIGDDLSLDLPIRSFPISTEDIGSDPRPFSMLRDPEKEKHLLSKEKNSRRLDRERSPCFGQKRERSYPYDDCSPAQNKRARTSRFRRHKSLGTPSRKRATASRLPRTEEAIEHQPSTDSSSDDETRTGDKSRRLCLPTIAGKHRDLHSITPETLARVVNHAYSETIAEAVIVDCRYPYEYRGGHIEGAINCYTKDDLLESFLTNPRHQAEEGGKRSVLIFHCEFSSERAPKMSRFLRKMDRNANKESYPNLFYPEVYLLDGGYKNFFSSHKGLCTPQSYVPMHHEDYRGDMRKFRIKSKSWSGDKKSRSVFGF